MNDLSPEAKTVQRLVAAWEALDPDAVADCFPEDGIWHNIPYSPIIGRDAIRAAAVSFLADKVACRFEVPYSGEVAPGVIMNERVDIFERQDGTELRFPVAGIFEVQGDRITKWRDYFDAGVMAGV